MLNYDTWYYAPDTMLLCMCHSMKESYYVSDIWTGWNMMMIYLFIGLSRGLSRNLIIFYSSVWLIMFLFLWSEIIWFKGITNYKLMHYPQIKVTKPVLNTRLLYSTPPFHLPGSQSNRKWKREAFSSRSLSPEEHPASCNSIQFSYQAMGLWNKAEDCGSWGPFSPCHRVHL